MIKYPNKKKSSPKHKKLIDAETHTYTHSGIPL